MFDIFLLFLLIVHHHLTNKLYLIWNELFLGRANDKRIGNDCAVMRRHIFYLQIHYQFPIVDSWKEIKSSSDKIQLESYCHSEKTSIDAFEWVAIGVIIFYARLLMHFIRLTVIFVF